MNNLNAAIEMIAYRVYDESHGYVGIVWAVDSAEALTVAKHIYSWRCSKLFVKPLRS